MDAAAPLLLASAGAAVEVLDAAGADLLPLLLKDLERRFLSLARVLMFAIAVGLGGSSLGDVRRR